MKALPEVAWWTEEQLSGEGYDLFDLCYGSPHRLQLGEITGLDLLKCIEYSILSLQAFFIQRLVRHDRIRILFSLSFILLRFYLLYFAFLLTS